MSEQLKTTPQLDEQIPIEVIPDNIPEPTIAKYGIIHSVHDIVQSLERRDTHLGNMHDSGYSQSEIKEARVYYDNEHITPLGKYARADLVKMGHTNLSKMDNRSVVAEVLKDYRDLKKETLERSGELERYAQEYLDTVLFAVRERGFPLTEEQVRNRLENVWVGFSGRYGMFNNSVGTYAIEQNAVRVRVGSSSQEARDTIFHELTHALAGTHIHYKRKSKTVTQHGFAIFNNVNTNGAYRNEYNVSLDESITDAVSLELQSLQDSDFRFDEQDHGATLSPLLNPSKGAYRNEKKASQLAQGNAVRLSTAVKAYFKSDDDPYEDDKYAKTHAMRDFYRELRSNAGQDSVKRLRRIDKLFSHNKDKKAIRLAMRGKKQTDKLIDPSKIEGLVNIHDMHFHESNRQLGIAAVKEFRDELKKRRHMTQKLGGHGVRGAQSGERTVT